MKKSVSLTTQQFCDRRTAAAYIDMSIHYLRKYRAQKRGTGPAYYKIVDKTKYKFSDLDIWLASRRIEN